MDLQTRKIEFVQEFLKLQSEELVSQFENLLKSKMQKSTKPMSVAELNSRMDQSENDFKMVSSRPVKSFYQSINNGF